MKIKLTKEQIELLRTGAIIRDTQEGAFYFLPYFFKWTKENDIFEQIPLDNVPVHLLDLLELILNKRN